MATFFTSDTHFGDHRVLNLYPRPFESVAEMDAGLVRLWNETCAVGDEVWHLGDFARSARRAEQILSQLNGRKHLVIGNNDQAPALSHGWESVAPYTEIERDGVYLILCHYPFRSWKRQHRGSLNLHGHSHGRMKPLPRQFDVGVDVRNYRPVALGELIEQAERPRRRAVMKVTAEAPQSSLAGAPRPRSDEP